MSHSIVCQTCHKRFTVSPEEAELRRKVSPVHAGAVLAFPPPTHCPACRAQRRWAFRNEKSLYRVRCGSCGKGIISVHRDNAGAPIFCYECWWSDKWDGRDHGRAIDWQRPLFSQFGELLKNVPECGIYGQQNENCEYNSQISWSKNCYLSFLCYYSQGALYSYSTMKGTDVVDCYRTQGCELCYEGVYLENCYRVHFSDHCRSCNDSAFLSRCQGCKNCFFCTNLRNSEYCMFNRQLTKAEYENALAEFSLGSRESLASLKERFRSFRLKAPFPATHNESCENVTGDYLRSCESCFDCFDLTNCSKCLQCLNFWGCSYWLVCVSSQTELGY